MFLNDLKIFLEKLDTYRDKVLFVFIKPFWPRKISPNQLTYVRIAVSIVLFVLLFLLVAEVFNAIVAIFYKSKDVYKANIFGKTRMVILSVVFVVILIVWPASPPTFFIDVLWFSLLFS